MDAVIPWTRLLALIEPHYPKAGNGTQPKPMEQMLRIYFMQNWFNLSDPQAEDSLYDIESMRRFAGIELLGHDISDETTILRFRHLLEQHRLTEQIFAEIRSLLEEKRLLLKSGTIVDATIIAAPPSTKNEQGARDWEMRQTKKGWATALRTVRTKRALHHAEHCASSRTSPPPVAKAMRLPRLWPASRAARSSETNIGWLAAGADAELPRAPGQAQGVVGFSFGQPTSAFSNLHPVPTQSASVKSLPALRRLNLTSRSSAISP
jgi:hypothetical protein